MVELFLTGLVIVHALCVWRWLLRTPVEQERQHAPQPTKYQTEPITLAVETHRGKMVVIAKSRNDRTILKESDLFPLSDELRKYHQTVTTVNEIMRMDGVIAEETIQNDPPTKPEHDRDSHGEAMMEYRDSGKQVRIAPGEVNHLPNTSRLPEEFYGHMFSNEENIAKKHVEHAMRLGNLSIPNDMIPILAQQYIQYAKQNGIPPHRWAGSWSSQ